MQRRSWLVPAITIALLAGGCTDPSPDIQGSAAPAPTATAPAPAADWNEADRAYVPAVIADLDAAEALHEAVLTTDLPGEEQDLISSLEALIDMETGELTALLEAEPGLERPEPKDTSATVGQIEAADSPAKALGVYLPAVVGLYESAIGRGHLVIADGEDGQVDQLAQELTEGLEEDLEQLQALAED